jgi:RecA/RadA recombinase
MSTTRRTAERIVMPRKAAVVSPASVLRDRVNATLKSNVVTLGNDPRFTIEKIPTGSLVVDRLTGGGFARGRHSVLYGDWQVAKSLIVYRTLALAQQRGETAALIDTEHTFSGDWFSKIGGNPDNLVLYPDRESSSTSRSANEMGSVLRTMIQTGEGFVPADVVGIDSVASLLPNEEIDHDLEAGDPRVASLARLMPLLLRMLTTMNDQTAFIWTNQWRDKISSIPGLRSTPGGRSLGFFASTMIEMAEGPKETEERETVYGGKQVKRKVTVGRWVNCTVRKEKTGARPEVVKSFLLDFDLKMPSPEREIIDLGLEDGFVQYRANKRYYVEDTSGKELSFHGAGQFVKRLKEDEELRAWLVALIEERTYEMAGSE